jgi:post-segregation antitoxin (ccd killing protein)
LKTKGQEGKKKEVKNEDTSQWFIENKGVSAPG